MCNSYADNRLTPDKELYIAGQDKKNSREVSEISPRNTACNCMHSGPEWLASLM